jgi:hypothetical protein
LSIRINSTLSLEGGVKPGDLSETEWRVLNDLLPFEVSNRGRGPWPVDNLAIIDGVLRWTQADTLRHDVPEKYGK